MASSSTSASFNVRELLELERQLYQESIDRNEKQHDELMRGTLEAFVVRCIPFEDEKGWETEAAMVQLQLNKRNGLDLLEFELKQAEDVHQAQRQELKQQLLKDAHTKLRQVQTRLTTLSARKAHASPALLLRERQRNHIRSKRRKLENTPWTSPVSASAAAQRHALLHVVADAQQCTQNAFNLRHLVHGIPPAKRVVDEVCQELEQLQHRMEKYSSESSKVVTTKVIAEKQELCVIEANAEANTEPERADSSALKFHVDDFVILTSRLTEEEFYGQITAIAEVEVQLVLTCGTNARVTIDALETQRCSLRHQREPQTAQELLRYDERTILDTKRIRVEAQLRKKGKRKRTLDIRRGF